MNDVFLVTIMSKSAPIFRFVGGTDEGRANYLAGACIDGLADYHGLEFGYSVERLPYAATMTPETEVVRLALESDV